MNYNELKNIRDEIIKKYFLTYQEKGFIVNEPLPLDNKEDITIDFTTCTICTAKENIRKNLYGSDYIMIQPAMRNTHIDTIGNIKEKTIFLSYFTMMGGFKYYKNISNYENDFNDIVVSEFDFLHNYFDKIILTIPVQYLDKIPVSQTTIEKIKDSHSQVVYSKDDENNLKWKYGIKGVKGYGTRWEVQNNGDVVNWGNTINVYRNDIPYGVDFGGGLETLIYAYKDLPSSVYANTLLTDLVKELCIKGNLYEKIIDCIISIIIIFDSKDNIVLRDKYILDEYARFLNCLLILTDTSFKQIKEIIENILKNGIFNKTKEEIYNKFLYEMEITFKNFDLLINSSNIGRIVDLVNICYNNNDDWKNSKKIVKSHFAKYFRNLKEIELLAILKKYNSIEDNQIKVRRKRK